MAGIVSRVIEMTNSDTVVARFVDVAGRSHMVSWTPVNKSNIEVEADAQQSLVELDIANAEFERAIKTDATLVLHFHTLAQFAARVRERYRSATREELARLAAWIISRITAGDFTENQVRNAFGLTVPQWTTLKAKMETLRSNYLAIQSAVGE